jgi:hypothetical protein
VDRKKRGRILPSEAGNVDDQCRSAVIHGGEEYLGDISSESQYIQHPVHIGGILNGESLVCGGIADVVNESHDPLAPNHRSHRGREVQPAGPNRLSSVPYPYGDAPAGVQCSKLELDAFKLFGVASMKDDVEALGKEFACDTKIISTLEQMPTVQTLRSVLTPFQFHRSHQ